MLCSTTNRIVLSGSPSTCALDTSITPLPSFLLIGFLVVYVPTYFFLSRRAESSSSNNSSTSNPSSKPTYASYGYSSPSESPSRRLGYNRGLPRWLHWAYVALVVCLLGLRILEIARLVVADMGVGLLPVTIIVNVVNIMMIAFECSSCGMGRSRNRAVSASLAMYWALSTVLESIKVTRLASYNALHPAKDTAYPSSDWLLDNGCMLGLMVIFLFIEGTYLVLRCRSSYLPTSPPMKERSISNPRPLSEYEINPVLYMDERKGGV